MNEDNKKIPMRVFSFYKLFKFDVYTQYENESFLSETRVENVTKVEFLKLSKKIKIYKVAFDYYKTYPNAYIPKPSNIDFDIDHSYIPVTNVFFKNQFKAFVDSDSEIVIFDCSYKLSDKFLNSIHSLKTINNKISKSSIFLEKYEIDLKKIRRYHDKIGIWYTFDGKILNTTSTGVFGVDVEHSRIKMQIEEQGGRQTALVLRIEFNSELITAIVSANGSISISTATTFDEAFSITNSIISELILKA